LCKKEFLSHTSGSRHAKRSQKGFKDAEDHLFFETILSQTNGSLDWRPGTGKIGQKLKNMSSFDFT